MPRALLIAGLWNYRDVDPKKSAGRLNILFNQDLRAYLTRLARGEEIRHAHMLVGGKRRQIFPSDTVIEPNLAAMSLRQLIPSDWEAVEIPLADVASDSVSVKKDRAFDVALLSTTYITNFKNLSATVESIRAYGPRLVIAGGYLAARNPDRALAEGIDIVCVGDAEQALPMLMRAIDDPAKWQEIPNLAFRRRGFVVRTATAETRLDDVPLTAPAGLLKGFSIPYETMRGCPYDCAFCSYPLPNRDWRYKSAGRILQDFEELQSRGAERIIALDSTFTVPRSRLREFLELYERHGLTISWGAYARAPELCDEATVRKLVGTNCKWLSVGFESGSEEILRRMRKRVTVRQNVAALNMLRRHKIAPWSNFIIGYPGETVETAAETLALIKESVFGFYGLYVFNIRDLAMPVLSDPVANVRYSEIDGSWSHTTMQSDEALSIRDAGYAEVVKRNPQAINIDVFRGTGVESTFTPWDGEFQALKTIEMIAYDFVSGRQDEREHRSALDKSLQGVQVA